MKVEKILKHIETEMTMQRKKLFLYSFVLGILVHFAGYSTYKTMNADVLYGDFAIYSPMRIIRLGRWGIPLLEHLRGGVAANVLVSLISIFFMALTAVVLVEILQVPKKSGFQFLICSFIVVMPAYAALITYFYCSDFYSLAIFLLVAGVYAIRTHKMIGMGLGVSMLCNEYIPSLHRDCCIAFYSLHLH